MGTEAGLSGATASINLGAEDAEDNGALEQPGIKAGNRAGTEAGPTEHDGEPEPEGEAAPLLKGRAGDGDPAAGSTKLSFRQAFLNLVRASIGSVCPARANSKAYTLNADLESPRFRQISAQLLCRLASRRAKTRGCTETYGYRDPKR